MVPSRSFTGPEARRAPGGVCTWHTSQTEDVTAVLKLLGLGTGPPPGWITEPERLSEIIEVAGFGNVQVTAASHTFIYRDLEQYWQNALSTGQRRKPHWYGRG